MNASSEGFGLIGYGEAEEKQAKLDSFSKVFGILDQSGELE